MTTLQDFFHKHTKFAAKQGEILIQDHEQPRSIFFLETGIVKQTVVTSTGRDLCLNLYKSGSFFPLMSSLAGIPNRYMFISVLTCTGWKAPTDDVKSFLLSAPEVVFDLNTRLLKGLHGMLLKTQYLMQGNAQSLLVQTLLTLQARFSRSETTESIEIPLTHQQLAEITGLSRETVTRELLTLRSLGILNVEQHRLHILDAKRLQLLAENVSLITVT